MLKSPNRLIGKALSCALIGTASFGLALSLFYPRALAGDITAAVDATCTVSDIDEFTLNNLADPQKGTLRATSASQPVHVSCNALNGAVLTIATGTGMLTYSHKLSSEPGDLAKTPVLIGKDLMIPYTFSAGGLSDPCCQSAQELWCAAPFCTEASTAIGPINQTFDLKIQTFANENVKPLDAAYTEGLSVMISILE